MDLMGTAVVKGSLADGTEVLAAFQSGRQLWCFSW
jgi:hypothetical protein